MRVLKFRIWDNLTNEMHYDALVGNCRGESTVPCVYLNEVGWAHTDNCVVEQFTGLLDKNGTEIYEGDIVREHANDYTPIYQNGIYMAYNVDKINDPYVSTQFNVIWRNGCEVIGNIHDID